MFADHADERDQADLGINVNGREAETHEDQGTADGHGHRDQHDDGVAEALELRGKHEVDDDQREEEGEHQYRALSLKLARLTRVVHGVAGRQDFLARLFEHPQRLAQRHARSRYTGDDHRVQLLESFELLRFH